MRPRFPAGTAAAQLRQPRLKRLVAVSRDDALQPGYVLETVLVGYPVASVVSLWHDDATSSTWRIQNSESLTQHMAIGGVARSEVVPNRFREAGLFNPDTETLLLPQRYPDPDGNMVAAPAVRMESIPRDQAEHAVAESDPSDFFARLGPFVVSAARRGEFVAIETGGWTIPFAPFVLLAVLRDPGGEWQSHVETSPVPRGAPIWSGQPQPADETGTQVLRAPASVENITAGSTLACLAVARWSMSLLDIGLSFGPAPAGPWSG
jgi:hypothetical protein